VHAGNFASDTIAKTQQWTLRIPPTLKPGNYLLRHEAIALHSAESPGNAQM
jgi:cellulase